MQELLVFDFKIKYYKGKKNLANRLSCRLDYLDSNKVAAALKALLASFLNRFSTASSLKVSVKAVDI